MLYFEAHAPAQHSPENAGLQMRGIGQSYDSSTSDNDIVDMLSCVAAQGERGTYCTKSDTPLSAECARPGSRPGTLETSEDPEA